MSLVFGGFIPESITIYSDNTGGQLPKPFSAALSEWNGELYCMKPDVVVVVNTAGALVDNLITINIAQHLLSSDTRIRTDVPFATALRGRTHMGQRDLPVSVIAEARISPEVAAPLQFISAHLPDAGVVSVTVPTIDRATLMKFGDFIHHEAMGTTERIAVVGVGQLSDTANASPYHGQSFDTTVLRCVTEHTPDKLLNVNDTVVKDSSSVCLDVFAVLYGVMGHTDTAPKILYSQPYQGAGQLILHYELG